MKPSSVSWKERTLGKEPAGKAEGPWPPVELAFRDKLQVPNSASLKYWEKIIFTARSAPAQDPPSGKHGRHSTAILQAFGPNRLVVWPWRNAWPLWASAGSSEEGETIGLSLNEAEMRTNLGHVCHIVGPQVWFYFCLLNKLPNL